jgi:hypothetical protein
MDRSGRFPLRRHLCLGSLTSVADKIDCAPWTLSEWVKRAEINSGVVTGVTGVLS